MDNLEDVTRLPEDFGGRVRLFPLPELVVFPHAMQPLHLFEPRYCEMLADSLASDELIAMATLETPTLAGGVVGIGGGVAPTAPPIADLLCVGRIVSHSELEDDRHNILLVGVRRARLLRELETSRPYRMADVEILDDIYPPAGASSRRSLKGRLLEAFGKTVPPSENVQKNLYELMAGQMRLGPITDIVSFMLPFSTEQKLQLLGTHNVDDRAERIIQFLAEGSFDLELISAEVQKPDKPQSTFPPPFSVN
ncbi:MAG: LON peptidase substrate-binding domain-containing protein [Planctomycetota bacterium]